MEDNTNTSKMVMNGEAKDVKVVEGKQANGGVTKAVDWESIPEDGLTEEERLF
jgi:hypothetical protein